MTPPLMYYSAAWVWLEYLTRGPAQAEQAMSDSLKAADHSFEQMQARASGGLSAGGDESARIGGNLTGELIENLYWRTIGCRCCDVG